MRFLDTIFRVLTAMVGYTVNDSLFWAIINFIFAPLSWAKWLIFHDVNMTILRETFTWFFT